MITVALSILVIASVVIASLRFILGPTNADRIVALDILFSAGVIFSALAALISGRVLFLDIAIGVTMVGFVATLAWARLLDRFRGADEDYKK